MLQIECPHCSAKLQLGSPKPGRFKPTCKQCGKAFLLQVSNGDPPVVRVGKPPSQSSNADDDHRGPKPAGRTIGSDPMAETAPGGSAQAVDQHEERSAVKAPAENGSTPGQDLLPPPSKLGGYKIVRMIGRGAMGAVYQAKQISLDRDVALKTIRGRLAQSPTSLARFTREAYAAAQLSHHNVVQIYDFGEEDGQHFFSMEWVRGGSLGDLVREKGTVDPKLAATYILQAARGLQFAHQSGMVHRDIKPANLLLSDDGVVKVADLGLVKVPDDVESDPNEFSGLAESVTSGTQVTLQGTAVGTPAYMAPEQSADATSVDHRADIYSLGCSLFYLLIGHSPFEAESVTEVMKRHAEEPLPDLQKLNPRVPARLSVIVGKAMAKRPERRYESLATMITDLQSYLGIESAVGFSPSTDQADRWEEIARSYSKSQGQKLLAGPAVFGLALLAALAVVLTIVAAASAEDPISVLRWLPFGPVCLMTAVVASITLAASFGGSAVANSVRRLVGSLSWIEFSVAAVSLVLILIVLLAGGFWLSTLLGVLSGVAAGAAFHFMIIQRAEQAGRVSVDAARTFVRNLRISGADEASMRDFLARYAGNGWQSIYEALFGYEALLQMRQRLAEDRSFNGPTSGGRLRDRVCAWLMAKVEKKRVENERSKLARIERQALVSQGVNPAEASDRSWQMASALMDVAGKPTTGRERDERRAAEQKRQRIKAMLAEARRGKYETANFNQPVWQLILSGYTRMLFGAVLLVVFVLQLQQLGLVSSELVDDVRSGQINDLDLSKLPSNATTNALGRSANLWSIGIAGTLMCLSAFVSGWRMTLFAFIATAIILFGPSLGIPGIPPLDAWLVAVIAGLVVYLPGIVFGEDRRRVT